MDNLWVIYYLLILTLHRKLRICDNPMKHVLFFYEEGADKPLDLGFRQPCCPPGEDMPYHKLALRYRALRDAPCATKHGVIFRWRFIYVYIKFGWWDGNLTTQWSTISINHLGLHHPSSGLYVGVIKAKLGLASGLVFALVTQQSHGKTVALFQSMAISIELNC